MAAEIVIKFLGDSKRFNRTARTVGRDLDLISSKSAKVGVALAAATAAVATGVGAVAVKSVKAFASFDDALNQSLAIMGNVSDTMRNDMSDAARKVGRETRFSATEGAEALFYLASAGFNAEQSLDQLDEMARFAQAGMFDLSQATELATDAQNAMGLVTKDVSKNTKNLTRVTDVLVKANTQADATVEQFSIALTNKAGPALRQTGKDIEEGAAILSVFAMQGIKAEKAGTALHMVTRDLQTKAIKNAEGFKALGISVFDASGEMRHMADIVKDFETAFAGVSTQGQREALMQTGLTDRSIAPLLALIGFSDELREFDTTYRKAGGTVDEVSNNQLKSMAAQWDLIKGKFEDGAITIGSKLAPGILKGFDLINKGWEQHGGKLESGLDRVFAAGKIAFDTYWPPLKGVFSDIAAGFSRVWDEHGQKVIDMFNDMGEKVRSLIDDKWPEIVNTFKEVGKSLENIFAEAIVIVTRLWELFGEDIMATIGFALSAAMQLIKGVFKVIEGLFKIFSGILTGDWDKVWQGIKDVFFGALNAIVGFVKLKFLAVLSKVFGVLGKKLVKIIGKAGKGLGNAFLKILKKLPSLTLNALKKLGPALLKGFGGLGKIVFKGVRLAFKAYLNLGKFLFKHIKKFGKGLFELFDFIFGGGKGRVTGAIKSLGSKVVNAFSKLFQFVKEFALSLLQGGKAIFSAVKNIFLKVVSIIKSAGSWLLSGFKTVFAMVFNFYKSVWIKIFTFAKSIVLKVVSVIINTIKKVPSRVGNSLGSLLGRFRSIFSRIKSTVSSGIRRVLGSFSSFVRSIRNKGRSFLSAGKSLGSKLIDGIKRGITGLRGIASNFANAVKNRVKKAINSGVIQKVNKALEFSIKIPGLGKTVSINAPDIPFLAKGAFFGKGSPTLAVVGESTRNNEFVAPEPMLREVVREEAGGAGITIESITMNNNASLEDLIRSMSFALRARRFS